MSFENLVCLTEENMVLKQKLRDYEKKNSALETKMDKYESMFRLYELSEQNEDCEKFDLFENSFSSFQLSDISDELFKAMFRAFIKLRKFDRDNKCEKDNLLSANAKLQEQQQQQRQVPVHAGECKTPNRNPYYELENRPVGINSQMKKNGGILKRDSILRTVEKSVTFKRSKFTPQNYAKHLYKHKDVSSSSLRKQQEKVNPNDIKRMADQVRFELDNESSDQLCFSTLNKNRNESFGVIEAEQSLLFASSTKTIAKSPMNEQDMTKKSHFDRDEQKAEHTEIKVHKKVAESRVRESEEEQSEEQDAFEPEEEITTKKGSKKPLLKVKPPKSTVKKPRQPRATSKAAANLEPKADEQCAIKSEIRVTKVIDEEEPVAASTSSQLVEEIPIQPTASTQIKVKSLSRKTSKSKLEEKVEVVEPVMSVATIEESSEETKSRRKKKVDYKETQLNSKLRR